MALLPLKCTHIPRLLHVFLKLLLNPLLYDTTRKMFLFVLPFFVVSFVCQRSVVSAKPVVDFGVESL